MSITERQILDALEAALRVMVGLQGGRQSRPEELKETISECRMARLISARRLDPCAQ